MNNLDNCPSNFEQVCLAFDSLDSEKQTELKEALAEEISINMCQEKGSVTGFIGMHLQRKNSHVQCDIGELKDKAIDIFAEHVEENNRHYLDKLT